MILRSDPDGPRAGVTLFETLVSLSILALVLAVVATSVRPPSVRLQTAATLAELARQGQELRFRAVNTGTLQIFDASHLCDNAPEIVFYPDGTGSGGPLCISGQVVVLRPLTGLLEPES